MAKLKTFVVIFIFLITLVSSGLTLAYYSDSQEKVNHLLPGKSDITIIEKYEKPGICEPGEEVIKEVRIKNEGSKSFVRLMILVNSSSLERRISLIYNTSGKWKKEKDGYWYYGEALEENQITEPLLKGFIINDKITENIKPEIICYGESVNKGNYKSSYDAFNRLK